MIPCSEIGSSRVITPTTPPSENPRWVEYHVRPEPKGFSFSHNEDPFPTSTQMRNGHIGKSNVYGDDTPSQTDTRHRRLHGGGITLSLNDKAPRVQRLGLARQIYANLLTPVQQIRRGSSHVGNMALEGHQQREQVRRFKFGKRHLPSAQSAFRPLPCEYLESPETKPQWLTRALRLDELELQPAPTVVI